MTVPAGTTNRDTLSALSPNLQTGKIADPALRLAAFQYLFDIIDANWSAFISSAQGSSGSEKLGSPSITGVSGVNVFAQLVALKGLIDSLELDKAEKADIYTKLELISTTIGDSGADKIKASAITGLPGETVQQLLQELKYQVNEAVTGQIPPGSITEEMLAFEIATDAASVAVTDATNLFTSTNVEGALKESMERANTAFQQANDVKINVANAIGAPATSSDTGTVLANRITTEKGRLAAEIGDGNSSNTLKYLSDRLIVRSDAIATAVNGKGVPATSADTLAQLATKIGQITPAPSFTPGAIPQAINAAETIVAKNLNYVPNGRAIQPLYGATYRISFSIKRESLTAGWETYGRLYNETTGLFIGLERVTPASINYVTFTEDLTIPAGHVIRVYTKNGNGNCYLKDFTFATAQTAIFAIV